MRDRSRRGTRASWTRRLSTALLALAAVSCGDPTAQSGNTTAPPADGASSPFTVGEVPAGFEPVIAGVGNAIPEWGADSTGTDEPFTVLAPAGSTDPADRVVVSITGFEGYQGKLNQTLYTHGHMIAEPITVDGRDARHIPADADNPGVLVAVAGDDLAVRVVAPGASLEELTEILDAVEVPTDRTRAPKVPSPPAGLEVIGSVDVDAVLAMWFGVEANTDRIGALASTHAAGWMDGTPPVDEGGPRPKDLAVMTLPGGAADRDALASFEALEPYGNWTWEPLEVAGDPAMAVEVTEGDSIVWTKRSVWRWTEGDLVVTTSSSYGDEPLSIETLADLAAHVASADDESWERFVVEMTGGPGLKPDTGRVAITRGTHDGLEWLLQTAPQGNGESYGAGIDPTVVDAVDPCLKLSNRQRACVAAAGSPFDWVGYGRVGVSRTTFDDLVIISTTVDAASLRIATPAETVEVPLFQVPGSGLRAAVAFVDGPGTAACTDDFPIEPPEEMTFMRVDALDASGKPVECIGMGGHPLNSG